jgi:hypothetical protein
MLRWPAITCASKLYGNCTPGLKSKRCKSAHFHDNADPAQKIDREDEQVKMNLKNPTVHKQRLIETTHALNAAIGHGEDNAT